MSSCLDFNEIILKTNKLKSEIQVPGDKSITHRAIMFSSIAKGTSQILTSVLGRDNFATIRIFQQLGVNIRLSLTSLMFELAKSEKILNVTKSNRNICEIIVEGKGLSGLTNPNAELDCGNSGTTARLLCGLFSALNFPVTLIGDDSLSKRPFARVTKPLSEMGSSFSSDNLPLTITGGDLKGLDYVSPKSSAQVKSALVIAGMFANSKTSVVEPYKSRDHTERMLTAMGVNIFSSELDGKIVTSVEPIKQDLKPLSIEIPGDISAAMFFIVAGLLTESDQGVLVRNVGINPTRNACLDILKRMGAQIEFENEIEICGEPVADVRVRKSKLVGIDILNEDVALAVDEIPVLSVLASFANGITKITGAEELRVKESDRISMTVSLLRSYGVDVEELEDGLIIRGMPLEAEAKGDLSWKACGDHRISMCGAIMEFALKLPIKIVDMKSIETSYPTFLEAFE